MFILCDTYRWSLPVGRPHGCSNSGGNVPTTRERHADPDAGLHKSQALEFGIAARNISSVINTVFPDVQKCVSVHMHRRQVTVRFTAHSRIVGPQHGTCFASSFWSLEFGSGPWKLRILVHTYIYTHIYICACVCLYIFMYTQTHIRRLAKMVDFGGSGRRMLRSDRPQVTTVLMWAG
jgi:hypothetical protein